MRQLLPPSGTLVASALVALLTAAIAMPTTADAHKRGYHAKTSGHYKAKPRRRYTQREIDTLPVTVTRPDNSSHLIYDMYPLWAAKAFQPKRYFND